MGRKADGPCMVTGTRRVEERDCLTSTHTVIKDPSGVGEGRMVSGEDLQKQTEIDGVQCVTWG